MAQTIEGFVGDSMDNSPMTAIHWRVLGLITAGYFFDVIDYVIVGSLIPDMIHSNFATAKELGFVVSAQLVGIFIGCVGQGEFTDRFGRKSVYQFNLLLYALATIAGAFAPNYLWLGVLRFLAGIGLGAEQPLCFSYAAEYAPKRIRGRFSAFMQFIGGACVWPIGTLFVLAFRNSLHWNGIWIVIGACALVVFVLRFSLPESPRWLATHGQGQRALDILGRMGVRTPPLGTFSTDAASNTKSDPMRVVFRDYRGRVIAAMVCLFAFFSIALMLGTWLPNIMAHRGFSITKSLEFTLVIQIGFPCSSLFMMFALERFGRTRTAVAAFILAGVFSVAFILSNSNAMVLVTGFWMFFFIQLSGNASQIYASEVFPTNARGSGFGLAQGAGRLGSAVAVPIVPFIIASGLWALFAAIAIVLVIAAYAVTRIGPESRGLALDAVAPPTG